MFAHCCLQHSADAQRVPIINTYTHCPAHSIKDTELSSHDQFKSEDNGVSGTDQWLTACNYDLQQAPYDIYK